ncbi:MAG: ABC transporter ATP-binding protein [Erysipelotrichales bacterium]|nr:ABC transporter ATP-binding protein [Erysipelotrichales bacterium]
MVKKLLEVKDVSKEFEGNIVLNNINLEIYENEFVTLLGPSGCGKTTILRIIGGFEIASSGAVLFEGVDMSKIPSHKRPSNTVFQRYALFPHLNVFDNIAFGLRLKKPKSFGLKSNKEKEDLIKLKVERMLKLVGLVGYEQRNIHKLSGGQMQRVAIARALVNEPKVLLLDEPLAALDLKLRKEMQYELKDMQRNTGTTFIFVTHDQEEALTMSDRIVVMDRGNIQQIGNPIEVYNEPVNRFVAEFIGETNIIPGIMLDDLLVEFDGHKFPCIDKGFKENQAIEIVIRPEDIEIVDDLTVPLVGIVDSVAFKGVHYEIDVKTEKRTYTVHTTAFKALDTKVGLRFGADDLHIMELPDR